MKLTPLLSAIVFFLLFAVPARAEYIILYGGSDFSSTQSASVSGVPWVPFVMSPLITTFELNFSPSS